MAWQKGLVVNNGKDILAGKKYLAIWDNAVAKNYFTPQFLIHLIYMLMQSDQYICISHPT
jgi:hypothetical protein